MDVLAHHPNPDHDIGPVLHTLRSLLAPFYTVQPVTSAVLASHPWARSCVLLVLLSSDGQEGCVKMAPKALLAMQSYVNNGGHVLALGFDASICRSRVPPGTLHFWDLGSSSSIALLRLILGGSPIAGQLVGNAGQPLSTGLGAPMSLPIAGTRVASWDVSTDTDAVAAVDVPIGRGSVCVWNIALSAMPTGSIQAVMKYSLTLFELSKFDEAAQVSTSDLPSVPTHPLPQFLLSPTSKPHIVEMILQSLGIQYKSSLEPVIFKDSKDIFRFHFATILDATEVVRFSREAAESPMDSPRDIIVLTPGCLPSREATPRFSPEKFFAELEQSHSASSDGSNWKLGEALFYGEAVTSTQTLLERNLRLLSALPPPIVSVASFQLAGRGRGSNTWLSPEGCLQFSVHIRVSLSAFPASRLVFVQYLFGLAVVGACRDARALGGDRGARVRLKWPNDIYLELGGSARKAGGILVNTSFTGSQVDLIIGCGINVSTPSPMASLSMLVHEDELPSAETMLALILGKFDGIWKTFVERGGSWAPFEDAYLDAWMHSDQLVTVTTVSPARQVRIMGITPDHGLLRTIPETGAAGYIDLQPNGNSFDLMEGLIKAKT
ncbi:hypothetical protein K488DRAFT_39792 [Vararia minispora EC-137]|uniref:Uncharacterized protein n=1 Tax=Vararia minispora EC-137 TaxID=1314806 RepID=A0ACB8QZA3_9AGAM|nr:hypothetical protein K488DRAFT_39792 [Vararia minispora EC-137]